MCTSICKLQEHERNVELDKEASRTNTLNPSASFYVRPNSGNPADGTGRREGGRPSYMPMRSASMRETSYRYIHKVHALKWKKSAIWEVTMSDDAYICYSTFLDNLIQYLIVL